MKKFISGLMVLLLAVIFSLSANAAPGDLFVQIDLRDIPDVVTDQCSILKVMPDGTFSEFVSFTAILALTGLGNCDMDEAGIAIADNGDVYFSEDQSDSIIKATPDGVLSTFVTEAQITALTGSGSADLDLGMVIGPDGDLYFTDQTSDFVLKASIPGGAVSVILTEDQITAVTGSVDADLEGGIAFDCVGNLYITDSTGGDDVDLILILTPEGDLSIFVTEQEIVAVTGSSVDLDAGMTFFGNSLYVLDDNTCDCVIRITVNGEISLFLSEAQITVVTGNNSADLDGGIAVNQFQEVFIGDDGDTPDAPNILMSNPQGSSVSLFVTTQELRDFYTPPFNDPRLKGSMAFEGVDACVRDIPTLSEWGLITTAAILGIVGFMVIRRRKVSA